MEDQFGNNIFFVPCNCGAEVLVITHDKRDKDWNISSHTDDFYNLQNNAWEIFKHRVVLVWKILVGREYSFYDILVSDKNMQELMTFVKENM